MPQRREIEERTEVDRSEAILKGGDDGPAIVPGKPEESLLIRAVGISMNPRCRPRKGLSDAEHREARQLGGAGAPWPVGRQKGSTSTTAGVSQVTDSAATLVGLPAGAGATPPPLVEERLLAAERDRPLSLWPSSKSVACGLRLRRTGGPGSAAPRST